MIRKSSLVALAIIASAGAAQAAPAATTVKLHDGAVEGGVQADILSFKGIPFAQPPVGDLRWRPPQPVKAWTGVRKALAYGPDCAQNPFPGDAAPLGVKPEEDCLYANVWRPAQAASAKLPVMVWVYGGGFVNGGSSPAVYDGSQFARAGIVFVSFNYRLGRFGFFAHPALTKEAAGGMLGNYGLMDQVAALKWVKANIAAFGGDPDNVTLFGESAGGGSVLTHLTSPVSQGLFNRVIVESGGGRGALLRMRKVHEDDPAVASGESYGVAFAKSVGVEGDTPAALAALRAVPADKVVGGMHMMTANNPTYVGGPLLDGTLITDAPDNIIRAGHQAKVPVMIGANDMDIGFMTVADKDALFKTFGDKAAQARALFDPDGSRPLHSIVQEVAADRMMVEAARNVAQLVSAQGLPAYEYRFSYVAESMRKEWPGAPHATEIPYAFDTVAARYGARLTPADAAAARSMNAYWIAFAKTGKPGAAGGPEWPRYDAKADQLVNFTNAGTVVQADPWGPKLDLIAASATVR